MLGIYKMIVAAFVMTDKANRVRFFKGTFLVANVSLKIVFRMLFLTLNSANNDFLDWKLWWRTYTIKEALPSTRYVELVGKKEFAAVALDSKHETFVVHVAFLSSILLNIHLSCRPQISDLIVKKASTNVSDKYIDFVDVLSLDLASKLPENTGINNHAIEIVDGQQLPYGSIYNLKPVELKTLKTYIETNLANKFIKPSKSSAGAPILFDRKPNKFFWLYIDYKGLNNLIIKNRYPLPLVRELLDRLRRAKRFT